MCARAPPATVSSQPSDGVEVSRRPEKRTTDAFAKGCCHGAQRALPTRFPLPRAPTQLRVRLSPTVTKESGTPASPWIREVAGSPATWGFPGLPGMPEARGLPEAPAYPEARACPEAPGWRGARGWRGAPGWPEASPLPRAPGSAKVTETPCRRWNGAPKQPAPAGGHRPSRSRPPSRLEASTSVQPRHGRRSGDPMAAEGRSVLHRHHGARRNRRAARVRRRRRERGRRCSGRGRGVGLRRPRRSFRAASPPSPARRSAQPARVACGVDAGRPRTPA